MCMYRSHRVPIYAYPTDVYIDTPAKTKYIACTVHIPWVLNMASITRCAISRNEQISHIARTNTHTYLLWTNQHAPWSFAIMLFMRKFATNSKQKQQQNMFYIMLVWVLCLCALCRQSLLYARCVYRGMGSNGWLSLPVCSLVGFIAPLVCVYAYYLSCWGIALALNVAHTTGTQTTTTKPSKYYISIRLNGVWII